MNRKLDVELSLAADMEGNIRSHCKKTSLSVLLILFLANMPAWAVLGQSEASVSADQQYMKSEDHVQTFEAYKVHQLASTNGPAVREFVSPQGLVFGVTWQGRSMPNMNQLLGTYVTNLQTSTRAQTQIRHLRGLSVKTSNFVYSNFCRMQICEGNAYVPGLVPSNVSVEVIR